MLRNDCGGSRLHRRAVTAQSPHVMTTLNDAKWGPAPPMLPPGAQIAVLSGDPTKAAPYAVRLKFPGELRDSRALASRRRECHRDLGRAPHRHGLEARSTAQPRRCRPGSYALMPAGMNHFAFTRSETTIVLFGIGPGGLQVRESGGRSADRPTRIGGRGASADVRARSSRR